MRVGRLRVGVGILQIQRSSSPLELGYFFGANPYTILMEAESGFGVATEPLDFDSESRVSGSHQDRSLKIIHPAASRLKNDYTKYQDVGGLNG